MMHPTFTSEPSAARQFWNAQMEKHPTLHGILSILASIAEFFTGGHFLVRLGQKVVMTGGVIAETSLLFATLWVTADYTIPTFLRTFLSADTMNALSSLSQASFSLLPEIILASAIVTTVQHWQRASANWKRKQWVWASLYSAPTLTFLVLTLYTILTFSDQGGSITQASGAALAVRCFAGYSYALLELIYARIGTPTEPVVSQQDHLKTIETLYAEQQERLATLASQQQQALAALTEQHERRLGQLDLVQQQRLQLALQEVKSGIPTIDYEALTQTVTQQLEARFEAAMRQQVTDFEAAMRQRITITEASHEGAPTRQLEAPKKKREATPPASQGHEAASNILPLRQTSSAISGAKAEVYRLVEQGLSSYQIAPLVGKSPATIQRWIKDRFSEPQEREAILSAPVEAQHEASDPAM